MVKSIVFVHGYISDRRIWSQVREHWHGAERLVFPTLGGFWNGSEVFEENDFGSGQHVQQLVSLIETVSAQPAHLVGWSYGATLALLIAATRPDLVASVFAYEPGISSFVSDRRIAGEIQADRTDMAAPAIAALKSGDLERAVKEIVDGACAIDGMFETLDRPVQQIFLDNARTVPLMFAEQGAPNVPSAKSDFEKISCPVTMSIGERARPAYRLVAVEGAKIIPNAVQQVIQGGLHVAPVTVPKTFERSVVKHLAAVASKEA